MREDLAADVQIATDRGAVEVRDALPEAVRVQLGGMAPEHSVVLGDQVQAAPRLEHPHHFAECSARIGERLQHVAADRQVELGIRKRQMQHIAVLEADAVTEIAKPGATAFEVRFL